MNTAKPFKNGRSQAVRVTGDVILSPRNKFAEWLKLRDELLAQIPEEELDALDNLRDPSPPVERDWP